MWDFVEEWRSGLLLGEAFAGAATGDLDDDGVNELALVIQEGDETRLLIVSGATGEPLEEPHDVSIPGPAPSWFVDPALAVTLDAAAPERSLLLIGLPNAADRRGVVVAIDLSTRQQRYEIEGGPGAGLGAAIAPGPDWDGDGWLDYSVVAKGASGEPGHTDAPGFVSLRSGQTGAELSELGSDLVAIGATLSLEVDAGARQDLLVASWLFLARDGAAEDSEQRDLYSGGTLLTAFSTPDGQPSWAAWIENFGTPTAITRIQDVYSRDGQSLLLGVPYRGNFNAFDIWVPQAGQVLVVSSTDGRVQRAFVGSEDGDRFGRTVIGLRDLTGDGVGEVGLSVASIDRRRAAGLPAIRVLDAVSGQAIALTGRDAPEQEWGRMLVLVSTMADAPLIVTSVETEGAEGAFELRGLRLEFSP
jgi:hypothetical protein